LIFSCIVSAKFQNLFLAPDALQQNKSGLRPKEVGNHCRRRLSHCYGSE